MGGWGGGEGTESKPVGKNGAKKAREKPIRRKETKLQTAKDVTTKTGSREQTQGTGK